MIGDFLVIIDRKECFKFITNRDLHFSEALGWFRFDSNTDSTFTWNIKHGAFI